MDVVIKDLNVGVTVADGFVETRVLALLVSFKGLIGVVAVEAPHGVIPANGTALVVEPDDEDDNGFAVVSGFEAFEADGLVLDKCEVCCWLLPCCVE